VVGLGLRRRPVAISAGGTETFSSKPQMQVSEWLTFHLIAFYTFSLPPPASAGVPGLAKDGGKTVKLKDAKEKNLLPVSTAEYSPCGLRGWLNNTTLTLGMQNVFDSDPPLGPSRTTTTNRLPPSKAGSGTLN